MKNLNFESSAELRKGSFEGFLNIQTLKNQNLMSVPNQAGVYLILWDRATMPDFIELGTGGFFKSKNPNVSIETLKNAWVLNTVVVYVGKAGGSDSNATLRSRLSQYFEFGNGKNIGHYGGRYIWQIKESSELKVCWKIIKYDEPVKIEEDILKAFYSQYGKLPFANLRF